MLMNWEDVKYFRPADFDSKDADGKGVGTHKYMSTRVVFMLDALRCLIGRPVKITSAFRTPEHNAAEGGAKHSAHLEGLAVDVSTVGWTREQRKLFISYAKRLGFTGVGISPSFIHIDMAKRTASWVYIPGGQRSISVGTEHEYA